MSTNDLSNQEGRRGSLEHLRHSRLGFFIQVVVPVLGLLIPITLYYLSLSESEIAVRGTQNIVLLEPTDVVVKDVEVRYQNEPIGNIASLEFEITNIGEDDIDGKDIHYFNWYSPEGTKILSAEIIELTSGYGNFINVSGFEDNKLSFKILALNKNTSAKIRALISSTTREINTATSRAEAVIKGAKLLDESVDYASNNEDDFLSNLIAGGIWANLAKIILGGIVSVGILIAGVFSFESITKRYKKLKVMRSLSGNETVQNIFKRLHVKSYPEYVYETIDFMSGLDTPQLEALLRLSKFLESSEPLSRIINGETLPKSVIETIRGIKDQKTLNSVFTHTSLHEPQVVAEELIRLR